MEWNTCHKMSDDPQTNRKYRGNYDRPIRRPPSLSELNPIVFNTGLAQWVYTVNNNTSVAILRIIQQISFKKILY